MEGRAEDEVYSEVLQHVLYFLKETYGSKVREKISIPKHKAGKEDLPGDDNFDESRHKDGFYYHFTRCPMEKFARENGYLDVLPIGCNTDYLTCELNHGVLHRQSTLAEGGDICDYWIVGDKVKNPQ